LGNEQPIKTIWEACYEEALAIFNQRQKTKILLLNYNGIKGNKYQVHFMKCDCRAVSVAATSKVNQIASNLMLQHGNKNNHKFSHTLVAQEQEYDAAQVIKTKKFLELFNQGFQILNESTARIESD